MIQIAEFLLNIVNVKIGLVLIRINWFWFWFLMGDSVWYGFPVTDMSAMVNWFKLSIGFRWETEEFVKERERERESESESVWQRRLGFVAVELELYKSSFVYT